MAQSANWDRNVHKLVSYKVYLRETLFATLELSQATNNTIRHIFWQNRVALLHIFCNISVECMTFQPAIWHSRML